jgi:hypothetical protein
MGSEYIEEYKETDQISPARTEQVVVDDLTAANISRQKEIVAEIQRQLKQEEIH